LPHSVSGEENMLRGIKLAGILAIMLGLCVGCGQEKKAEPVQKKAEAKELADARAAAPKSPHGDMMMPSLDDIAGTEVDPSVLKAAGVQFQVPEGWNFQHPSGSMRAAQYELSGDAGPAEMAVFAFGPNQGGTAQANIDRWISQFENAAGPDGEGEPRIDTVEFEGLKVSKIQITGAFSPGASMGGSPKSPELGWAMYGIIVEGSPEGNLFIKTTGPEGTINAHKQELDAFAMSAKVAG
jgi:hypothetical protein